MNNEAQEIAVLRDALTRCVRASDRRLRTLPAAWGPTSSRIVQSNPRKCKPIVEQLVRDLEEGFRREEEEKLQKRKAESANQEPPNKRQRKETKPPKSENEAGKSMDHFYFRRSWTCKDAQLRREFEIEDGDLDDENSNFCLQQLEDYGLPAEFKEKALDKLMSKVLAKLRLFSLLPRVVRFLKNRRAQRDNSSLPVIAKEVDLLQLLRSLYAAEPTEGARKIHRIFAQIQFNKAIQKQVKEARETRPASTSIINHIDALKLLVDKEAGDVDDEEKRTRLGWAKREYAAGETWAHIIKTFGGPGIVFLFILASKHWG